MTLTNKYKQKMNFYFMPNYGTKEENMHSNFKLKSGKYISIEYKAYMT